MPQYILWRQYVGRIGGPPGAGPILAPGRGGGYNGPSPEGGKERARMSTSAGRILVALSGGVDSSTAAALLLEQGCEVSGVSLLLPRYGPEGGEETPGGAPAAQNARAVAARLGIPFQVLDCRQEFERTVLEDFVRQYRAGRTPNPCVRCNQWVKFGLLLEAAPTLGADRVATGHYARRIWDARAGRHQLHASPGQEDQSYFLFSLSQHQLGRAVFPLGGLQKRAVRAMARARGLPAHDRPSSQDLCFLPAGHYRDLLRERCPGLFRPGEIVHVSGQVLGCHDGVAGYTIGQRRGLRVPWREPLYVVALQPEANRVVVGERGLLRRREFTAAELNWVAVPAPSRPLRASVRIRHRHPAAPAEVIPLGDGRVRVAFDEPQEAPTPGQAAVFYGGTAVLGGGFIE